MTVAAPTFTSPAVQSISAPCLLRPLRPLSPYINKNNGPQTEENGEEGERGEGFSGGRSRAEGVERGWDVMGRGERRKEKGKKILT